MWRSSMYCCLYKLCRLETELGKQRRMKQLLHTTNYMQSQAKHKNISAAHLCLWRSSMYCSFWYSFAVRQLTLCSHSSNTVAAA
jgi:hypothetical protein